MRVLVCGSRNFGSGRMHSDIMNMELLRLTVPGDTVVHGGCRGADVMAGLWAASHGREEEIHRADWLRFGRAAGPIRNSSMLASDIDRVVAFWDGKSRGTMDMVMKARNSYVGEGNVYVVEYK